ncbi:hypothetical protein LWI29_021247 [Acer saccharum]|uniref:Uncharacterized protein n=1 Tax=Acer saccharum TaxID=4024 RepID=A0AA39RYS4_ACESA|nr:hypothetical protein LWI29_021247 [Acer saccharum]KAK1554734.1 hypothetical protein Q3G72_016533 [Acer saccharum]
MAPPTEFKCVVFNIVKLKKIPCVWQKLAKGGERKLPRDVPPGHLAVIVGKARRRFVIKADYLNQPVFRQLLDQAYEDYSPNKDGPLAIPCDEFHFESIINSFQGGTALWQFTCHVDEQQEGLSLQTDSKPLLYAL